MRIKNTIFLVALATISTLSIAQNIGDALRYSKQYYPTTARSAGLSGAFSSIGGDYSAMHSNPAGLGFITKSNFSISLSNTNTANVSSYIGDEYRNNSNNFRLPQMGLVYSHFSRSEEAKKNMGDIKLNFAFGGANTHHFNRKTQFSAVNKESSFTDYLAEKAGNKHPDYLQLGSLEQLAYDAYLISYDDPKSEYFSTMFGNTTHVNQSGTLEQKGFINEISAGASINYKDIFYGGLTLGVSNLKMTNTYYFEESDLKPASKDFESLVFIEKFKDKGSGFFARLGVMAKPNEYLRFGLAYQTSIEYDIEETFSQSITSTFDAGSAALPGTETTDDLASKYTVKTPSRFMLNAALLFSIGKTNIAWANELMMTNHSKTNISFENDPALQDNKYIADNYRRVNTYRTGVEIAKGKMRLRGGLHISPSFHKENTVPFVSDLANRGLSLGAGWKGKKHSLDFALFQNKFADYYQPYSLNSSLKTHTASNTQNSRMVMITYGYSFD